MTHRQIKIQSVSLSSCTTMAEEWVLRKYKLIFHVPITGMAEINRKENKSFRPFILSFCHLLQNKSGSCIGRVVPILHIDVIFIRVAQSLSYGKDKK